MCIKMMLSSELPVTQAWCIAAMETALGPSYRVAPGIDCMPSLDTPLIQHGIAMIVIEQVSGFAPKDVRQLIKWCHTHDKALLVCGALSEEERDSYGLSHCIEIDITALHTPVCIHWTSCAGTLQLFEEMFVPTLKTVQRTAHLHCSGLRCQHHRHREVTGTQRTRAPHKGAERRKIPIAIPMPSISYRVNAPPPPAITASLNCREIRAKYAGF
ncbi:hypothetical protein [Janthinobacterium sp. 1_2014MBL_MicDiv]|uniref:hypothetical protein n=1 Tax=Janthinobacterium sp. 1_2014MBL_MicDiv TaxID=1644131 RepID=UPI0012EBA5C4|nr:hypothetical protein [Janthinobacterium sp. 1_2014MBL_MicDiv]